MKRSKTSRPNKPSKRPQQRDRRESRAPGKASASAFHRTVIGIHATAEALKVNARAAQEMWVKEGGDESPALNELIETAQKLRIPLKQVGPKRLDPLGSGHQGVALHLSQSPKLEESTLEGAGPMVCLALDQVTDPHNLGAILRSSWLFGVKAVFVPEHRSASLTPTVSKVAQGGVEHVPVVVASPMDQALKRLKDQGFWIFGLSHLGSSHLFEQKLPEKVVWVLGAEGSGLRKPIERACDELVSIPQSAESASYNVAVAAGISLSETHRQHFFTKL